MFQNWLKFYPKLVDMTIRTLTGGFCPKRFGYLATVVQKWSKMVSFCLFMVLVCNHAASQPSRFGSCKLNHCTMKTCSFDRHTQIRKKMHHFCAFWVGKQIYGFFNSRFCRFYFFSQKRLLTPRQNLHM